MSGAGGRSGCASTAELLPELALGILSGTERADVLAHLDHCAMCRDVSMAWSATVDALPTVLAEAEPPAGFEARTLERIRADRDRVPRRSIWQRVALVAAIVAVVMIVTLAVVRIVDARDSGSAEAESGITSARMIGHSGHDAGNAFMTSGDDQYVFVSVDYGAKSGAYRVEAVDDADRVTALGNLVITGGQGAWAGEVPDGPTTGTPAMVRIIGANGDVFCQARFGPVAS